MQLKKWFVIVALSTACFLLTGGTFFAKNYVKQFEAEIDTLSKTCNMEGWK